MSAPVKFIPDANGKGIDTNASTAPLFPLLSSATVPASPGGKETMRSVSN